MTDPSAYLCTFCHLPLGNDPRQIAENPIRKDGDLDSIGLAHHTCVAVQSEGQRVHWWLCRRMTDAQFEQVWELMAPFLRQHARGVEPIDRAIEFWRNGFQYLFVWHDPIGYFRRNLFPMLPSRDEDPWLVRNPDYQGVYPPEEALAELNHAIAEVMR